MASDGTGKTYSANITNSGSSNISNYYRVIVGGDGQSDESNAVSVTWRPQLVAGSISGATTTFSNNSVNLTVGAASGGNNSSYSYQWQESTDDGSTWNNVGTNSTSYTATGSGQTKKYKVVVTDGDSQTATTEVVSVTWRSPVAIGSISGATTTYSGNSVTLNVGAASGGNNSSYSYLWKESTDDGNTWNIVGTNSTSYTATGSGQTKKYKVVVTDGDNQTATTEVASVTWRSPLVVGSISGSGVFDSNTDVTLSANPSGGDGNYTYQWQQSADDSEWSNISGENSQTITVNGTDLTKYYRVIIEGDSQTQTSASVSVVWGDALIAGTISGATTTCSGGNIELTVSAATGGNSSYTYQWQEYEDSEWSNISDLNDLKFSICIFNAGDSNIQKQFRVKVTDGVQTAYSEAVTATWRPALVAGSITGSGTITYSGSDVTLTANPSGGDGNYTYQWQVSKDNSEWTDIQGATFSELVETGVNEADTSVTMYYRVLVSGDFQNAESEVADVTRRPSLKISNIQPIGNSVVYSNDDVNLTITASGGDGNYSYQWYRKDAESDWTQIGGNSSSFTDNHNNNTDSSINYLYKVVVNGDSQEKTSTELQCSWVAAMRIDGLIYAKEKLPNGVKTPIEVIMANGSGVYDYQWQTYVDDEWLDIPDNDKPVLTITATTTADYRCIITDSLYPAMSVATEIARINVYPAWIPNETPQNSYVLDNDTITIGDTSAISSNISYHYRWEIWSANDSVFVPIDDTTATINVLPSTNTIYRRYDIIGNQEKLTLEIKVDVPLDGGTIAVDGLADFYYAGQQLPLLKSATAASGGDTDGSPKYQWYLKKENSSSFEPIEGATEADYQPSDLMGISSLYRAVIDGDDIMYSNTIDLIIKMPEIVIDNLKERYCKDEKVSIKASGVEGGLYKWFDTRGKQVGTGAELRIKSISENTTLIVKTYTQNDEFLGEKKVELTIVDMNPDFVSDRIIVDAGGAVHFTSIGTGFTQYEWDFGDGADGSTEPNPWHYYNGDGTFTVKLQLTNRDGCVTKIAKTNYITVNEATTDINEESASHISIYPNPATDFLMVESDDESQVTIISSTGAVMLERAISPTTRIDISAFPEGTYTVIVASGNSEVHREKIVKY